MDHYKTALKAQAQRNLEVRENNALMMKIAEQSGEPLRRTDIMQPDVRVLVPPKLPAFMLQPRPEESVLVSPPAIVRAPASVARGPIAADGPLQPPRFLSAKRILYDPPM